MEREVATLLHERFPDIELYDVELRGGRSSAVTVFIDRPGGVDLDTCATVSHALEELRDRHALEVSSPGLERRLRRPEHFTRVVGETVAVRTVAPRAGRSSFRGRIASADDHGVMLALEDGGELQVGYADIARAHLIYRPEKQRRPA